MTDLPLPEQLDDFSLRDVARILCKQWRILIVVFSIVVVAVTVWTFSLPRTYEVESTVLLKKARTETPMGSINDEITLEDLNSETEIVTSRSLLSEVAEELAGNGAPLEKGILESWKNRLLRNRNLSPAEALVVHFRSRLQVSPIRNSNVLRVAYENEDPEWATLVVRTLTEKYLAYRSRLYQPPEALEFLVEQTEQASQRLDEAEASLENYLRVAEVTMTKDTDGASLGLQKELTLQRLTVLQSALAEASAQMREQQETVAALRERLGLVPERLASPNQFNANVSIQEIEKQLLSLKLERDDLLQRYTPTSKVVRDLQARIELAESRLREERESVGMIDRTEINIVFQELKSDLLRAEADLQGTEARYATLLSQIPRLERDLEELNRSGFDLERLRREAESTENSYLRFRDRLEEAQISAAMDREKIIDVSIAQPAQPPLEPVGPKRRTFLMAGMLLGALLAALATFGVEYFDRSFSTPSEVEKALGLPVVASLAEES